MNGWRVSAAALGLCSAACGSVATHDVIAAWSLTPVAPAVGEPIDARLALREGERTLRGARITFEAHMSHPGMTPVVAEATEQRDGVYEAHLHFTMKGAWTVVAAGTLPDGRRLTRDLGTTTVY